MIDVLIIGGGPAGSTLGCYLSKMGLKTVILESEIPPRPHVGESLVMSTVRVFDEIGVLDAMEAEGFVHKFGASWHEINGRESSIRFADFPQIGINQAYTYHVDRAKFDHLLLRHAHLLGTEVCQGVKVRRVLFKKNQAIGVQAAIAETPVEIRSKFVVDASGRHTLLGNQLRIKKNDPVFNQYAVHAWFEGVKRGKSDTADYIHIYFLPVERGWAWQIPITKSITSVGIVTEREIYKNYHGGPEEYFNHYLRTNRGLAKVMRGAVRLNEIKTEGDYSYTMNRFIGERWLLVGDAARFVDPIFSSGVSVALYSAKFASEVIGKAFETGDFRLSTFLPYERKLKAGVDIWYEFIRLYYKLLPLFTFFIRSKDHQHEILKLLQGEVFDRDEVPVLESMRKYIEVVKQTKGHVFRGQLASIPLDDLPTPDEF